MKTLDFSAKSRINDCWPCYNQKKQQQQTEDLKMHKLTKEEQAEKRRGYISGRNQALKGRPWRLGEAASSKSEFYKEGHRQGYLSALNSKGIVEPTEFSSKAPKLPSNTHLAGAQKKGYESGHEDGYRAGFREALKALKDLSTKTFRSKTEWSDRKMDGYQWGYRQAKAGNPPHSSADLRSDPEFNEGYEMGYAAGSKVLQSA